ncbi:class I SAM-dependent methyltransferase [Erythrobacter sp. W53]|uniref:class I SAM-dependent methyltransferase n=1 Tax=Erythrobacter sp. W53 TaxID=3425947 RepID=UPI003D766FB1
MALDHSETYKLNKLKHIPHVARLWTIRNAVKKYGIEGGSLADFGCSNGYITKIISEDLQASSANGYDHSDNIEVARSKYEDLSFDYVDLNKSEESVRKFDTVTCFETIEHVGKPEAAIQRLLTSRSKDGVVIISVPVEIGVVGILKYLAKRIIYKYPLELDADSKQYFKSLLRGDRISQYRGKADGFSTHFGFDYRDIDDILRMLGCENYLTWRSFTSQFFVITPPKM